jgi:hypothetical protein
MVPVNTTETEHRLAGTADSIPGSRCQIAEECSRARFSTRRSGHGMPPRTTTFPEERTVVGRFLDDERLDKPWLTAVLGFVLELGNVPVSSRSVRHHHAPCDLRKRPVGHHPVPLFLGPRAIPKPCVAGSNPAVGAFFCHEADAQRG